MNDGSKRILKKIQLLSGKSLKDVEIFSRHLFNLMILDYAENSVTTIPHVGTFKINYEGDDIKKQGAVAKINIDFTPDPDFLKNIGQIVDEQESDVEKELFKKIKKQLKTIIEE